MHRCSALKQYIHPPPNLAPSNCPNLGRVVGICARPLSSKAGKDDNLPAFALTLGFLPRPLPFDTGSSDPSVAPSFPSPASLLDLRLRRLVLGTKRAGEGSAPATGQRDVQKQ